MSLLNESVLKRQGGWGGGGERVKGIIVINGNRCDDRK